jgi:hypothetical protein
MSNFQADACYRVNYGREAHEYEHHPELPTTFKALVWAKDWPSIDLATIAARFPKYVGIKVATNSLWFEVHFNADGVNKGKNEAGIKRLRKFLEIAGPLDWKCNALNGYKSLDDFLAAIR